MEVLRRGIWHIEFVTKTNGLTKQWCTCSMKIDAMREKTSGILGQVGDQWCDLCLFFGHTDGVLMEEKQGSSDAVEQLMSELLSERQNVLDYATGLLRSNVIS